MTEKNETLTTAADAAAFIERKAEDYAREFGTNDMGSLSFGNEDMRIYHWHLVELADEIRALAAPSASAQQAEPMGVMAMVRLHNDIQRDLAAPAPKDESFRAAVEAMVSMLEEGEWAEHVADTTGKGEPLAQRLESAITNLINEANDARGLGNAGVDGDRHSSADSAVGELVSASPASIAVTEAMVSRFLGWRLPDDFAPDCGVSFTPVRYKGEIFSWPIGTNLLSAVQARQMLEHVLAAPSASPAEAKIDAGLAEAGKMLAQACRDAGCPADKPLVEWIKETAEKAQGASPAALTELVTELASAMHEAAIRWRGNEIVVWKQVARDFVSGHAALLAASPADQGGWQPIEKAPKNQSVLVFMLGQQYVAYYQDDNSDPWFEPGSAESDFNNLWTVTDNKHGPYALRGGRPTHWMPLPPDPAMSATPPAGERGA